MSVPSVEIAKERVRSLVVADRMKCTPDIVEKMSNDIYILQFLNILILNQNSWISKFQDQIYI